MLSLDLLKLFVFGEHLVLSDIFLGCGEFLYQHLVGHSGVLKVFHLLAFGLQL